MKQIKKKAKELLNRYKTWTKESMMGKFLFSIIKIAFAIVIILLLNRWFLLEERLYNVIGIDQNDEASTDDTMRSCSVAGINLHGTILTYIPAHSEGDTEFDYDSVASEDIISKIDQANANMDIKAILVEVDSFGGSAVAGNELEHAITTSKKPVVAMIRDNGTSAAYLAVSGAQKIFASKSSSVGSIGVTSSYLSNVKSNDKNGYTYEQLSIGKYKDAGSPDKTLTKEERALIMRDATIIYDDFVDTVAKNRELSVNEVKDIADGSVVLGSAAKMLNLIDEVGGIDEVRAYLEEMMGERPEICFE
jgi:protease-4